MIQYSTVSMPFLHATGNRLNCWSANLSGRTYEPLADSCRLKYNSLYYLCRDGILVNYVIVEAQLTEIYFYYAQV